MRLQTLLTGTLALLAVVMALTVGLVAGVPADAPPLPEPAPTDAPATDGTLAAPAQQPDSSPSPSSSPPPFTDRALVAELGSLVEAARDRLAGGDVSVAVVTPDHSEVIEHRGDRTSLPASTMKLVTAAASLHVFGADHRFVTEARSTGDIRPDGTLDGDLVLVGVGDPALATPAYGRSAYPARPRTRLEDLADALVDAGLRRISGDVVGTDPGFDRDTLADGWRDSYLSDFDARHITGLTVDAGLLVRGGGEDGEPVRLELADRPDQMAAIRLRMLLEDRGVVAAGRDVAHPVDDAGDLLADVASPPLSELLRHTVQRSDNHMADTIFKAAGAEVGGAGTWHGGAEALHSALVSLGVDPSGARFADGSGLSRRDRLSATQLARLDAVMAGGPDAQPWSGMMAIMGVEGTLRHRLRGSVAEGRFLGKTGTLDDVIALAGSVTDPGADPAFHLAVIGNDVRGADRGVVRTLMDRLVLTLVADVDGCALATPRPDTSPSPDASPTLDPLGLPPATVRCPPTTGPEPAPTPTPEPSGG